MPSAWNNGQVKRFVSLWNKHGGHTATVAAALGVSQNAVRISAIRLRARGHKLPPHSVARVPGKAPIDAAKDEAKQLAARNTQLEHALEIERAKCKIAAPRPAKRAKPDCTIVIRPDVHGAYQDKLAVAGYLAAVRDIKPDIIIGLGDLIDAGSFLAAHHVLGYVAEGSYSVSDDVAAADAFLTAEQEASGGCQHVEIEGNHDHRIEQWCLTQAQRNGSGNVKREAEWLMSRFAPEVLFNFKARGFTHIKRGAMNGNEQPGTYRFRECLYTHGNFTGVDCVQRALSAYGENLVFGHTHRNLGYVRSMGSRTIGAWTVGCLAQIRRFWNHGKPTDWTHGFGVQTWSGDKFQHSNIVIYKGQALLHGAR